MASVVKYQSSQYWVAAFYDARGKQRRRTTRETNKKRALAVAEQFERVAKRQMSAAKVRKTFAEFYREHYREDLPQASVRSYGEQFLNSRKNETSTRSRKVYRLSLEKFFAFLGARADQSLDEITRTQIVSFRDEQLAQSAPATANLTLNVVKMLFKAARRDGVVLDNPAEGVKTVKASATFHRRAFTLDELRAILEVADDEWRSLIRFGLYTGQRLGDIALLTWSQIDLERDQIRMRVRKTNKQLLVPIATPLHEHLSKSASLDNPRAPVHPRAFKNVEMYKGTVADLSTQFAEILVSAGLREQKKIGKGIGRSGRRQGHELSFHSLRHTAVSLMKDAGVPDAVVMALVGHNSAAMSRHYTHVGKEALAKAAQSMPAL